MAKCGPNAVSAWLVNPRLSSFGKCFHAIFPEQGLWAKLYRVAEHVVYLGLVTLLVTSSAGLVGRTSAVMQPRLVVYSSRNLSPKQSPNWGPWRAWPACWQNLQIATYRKTNMKSNICSEWNLCIWIWWMGIHKGGLYIYWTTSIKFILQFWSLAKSPSTHVHRAYQWRYSFWWWWWWW